MTAHSTLALTRWTCTEGHDTYARTMPTHCIHCPPTHHVPGEPMPFTQEALPLPVRVDDSGKGVESPIPEGCVHDATICQPCATRRADGSWLDVNLSHCRTCHRSWSRNGRTAHCATCHEHFTTPGNFDLHLAPVNAVPCCRDPRTLTTKAGEAKLRQRDDGVWTGAGEYDREAL